MEVIDRLRSIGVRFALVGSFCVGEQWFVAFTDEVGFGSRHQFGKYETIVYPADSEGNATSWLGVGKKTYETKSEATKGHNQIVELKDLSILGRGVR